MLNRGKRISGEKTLDTRICIHATERAKNGVETSMQISGIFENTSL
jgi:hypothetical protein